MTRSSIVVYLNPWRLRREQEQQRVTALRQRDGDNCRRCRRELRFDLPRGHDQAPTVQPILPGATDLQNLCLCHARCNPEPGDSTPEVQERLRLKAEEALLSRNRSRKRARA